MLTWHQGLWEEDAERIFVIAEEVWEDIGLGTLGQIDINVNMFEWLYHNSGMVVLVGVDEREVIQGYFVGVVEPMIFQQTKTHLKQTTAGFTAKHREYLEYVKMVKEVEKFGTELGVEVISISVGSEHASDILQRRNGYAFNDITLVKEIN